jgi:hypothetical protein
LKYVRIVTRKTKADLPNNTKARVDEDSERLDLAGSQVDSGVTRSMVDHRPEPATGLFVAAPLADRVEELLSGCGEK